MKEKSIMIISYLNSSDDYTPSSSLAQYLNVSERSIKRYIKSINKELEVYGAKIDSAKGLGYKLGSFRCLSKAALYFLINGVMSLAKWASVINLLLFWVLLWKMLFWSLRVWDWERLLYIVDNASVPTSALYWDKVLVL